MDNSSQEILREWEPLTNLLQQIPAKAQRGIFTQDLNITCVDAVPEFIAVGTNIGLVYWYNRKKRELQRLRCENTSASITCVKIISTVDYMVAAGNDQGIVTVFQIPKAPSEMIPECIREQHNKQVERYTISGLHSSCVTAIEWSMNGMKLFSGDKNGLVVLTEIDFYMHLSKSMELLNEKYEIVQLCYRQQLLLVSTLYRTIICRREQNCKVVQVGQKERKSLGKLGAAFCPGTVKPQEQIIYSSRPGLRIWVADQTGLVQKTLIFKDALAIPHHRIQLINPAPSHVKGTRCDPQFGPLNFFKENLLVTYSSDILYILNPTDISVVATVDGLRKILCVAVCKDEIFILEGDRSLIRIAYAPEEQPPETHKGLNSAHGGTYLQMSESTSSLKDLTSLMKDSTLPFHKVSSKLNIFGRVNDELSREAEEEDIQNSNPIVTADEAVELPPVVAIPAKMLTEIRTEIDLNKCGILDEKSNKEVYNISQKGGSECKPIYYTEILDKIGEQEFEEILFKPVRRKKKGSKKQSTSGIESGSDTVSTTSAISYTSEGEDVTNSEILDSSCWSDTSDKLSPFLVATARSLSEETLVREVESGSEVTVLSEKCSECMYKSDSAAVTSTYNETEGECINENSEHELKTPTSQIEILKCLPLDFKITSVLPPDIKPDLRSPSSIQQDVASKEKILEEVLNIEKVNLCDINGVKGKCDTDAYQQKSDSDNKNLETKLNENLACSVPGEEKKQENYEHFSETSDIPDKCEFLEFSYGNEFSEQNSLASVMSYGPPSGSSAPSSNCASLEHSMQIDVKIGQPETSQQGEVCEAVEKAERWMQYNTQGQVVDIAVCNHYICCIDSKDSVFYSGLTGLGLKWKRVDYCAKQISMSPSGSVVWKLHKNTACELQKPSHRGPFGNKWLEVAKDIRSIAVSESTAWYTKMDGSIYVKRVPSCDKSNQRPIHVKCHVGVSKIACLREVVCAVTVQGKLMYRLGVCAALPAGASWKEVCVPSCLLPSLALGCQNTCWIVDNYNTMYFSTDFLSEEPHWWQVLISEYIFQQTTPLQQIRSKISENLRPNYLTSILQQKNVVVAAGENTIWVSAQMSTFVHMNKSKFTGHKWHEIRPKYISPSMKWDIVTAEGIFQDRGQLWLLNSAGDLFCSRPNSLDFHALPLPCNDVLCLAAAPGVLWILNAQGKIFMRQGLSDICTDGFVWTELDLSQIDEVHLVHISCGTDVVWACDNHGVIHMAVISPSSMENNTFLPAWVAVDGSTVGRNSYFTKVCVGPRTHMVWALDNKKNVYVREAIFPDFQVGMNWVVVSGIEAVDLTISDSAVWALSPNGDIYKRYGISETNFIGDYWKKIPGSVTALTASALDDLWAVNKNGILLQHTQHTVRLSEEGGASIQVNSVESDWEVV